MFPFFTLSVFVRWTRVLLSFIFKKVSSSDVGRATSDVGRATSDVGRATSDVGRATSDVGRPAP